MQLRTVNRSNPPRIAAFNLGIQFVWGAILAVSLQSRCIELTHGNEIKSYALIAAIGAGIAAIVQVAIGHLSDSRVARTGHRREFYLIGTLTSLPLLLWFFGASSFAQLMMAFFGLQIAMNVANGPYQAAIPDHVPATSHGTTASWMSAFQSVGSAAGLIVAGFVHDEVMVGCALAAGLGISFMVTYLHIRTLPVEPSETQALPYSQSLATLLISRGLINIGFYILLGFLVFYVRDSMHVFAAEAQRMDAALLFLTFTLMGIIGALLSARPANRYDKRAVVSVVNTAMIAALLTLAATHLFTVAFLSAAVAGISWGAFVTVDWAIACAILPRKSIATAMGIWNLASVVPQVLAPLFAAPLVIYGNSINAGLGPRLAMAAAATALAFGTLCIWRIPLLRATPQ